MVLFQFHNLKEGYLNSHNMKGLPYDYPIAPVKCHAPFNHFILIKMEQLQQIGKLETWCSMNLLQDEDLGLRAAKLGMFNIWIPKLEYVHKRIIDGTRTGITGQLRCSQPAVHQQFFKKWGFVGDFDALERKDLIKKK